MHLTLFFTRGNSLATWHSTGSFEREILLYRALQERGMQISFVTYGTSEEKQHLQKLSGIKVLYNRWNLPLTLYELFLPWLHAKSFKQSDLIKTNQMKGAHTALFAGFVWNKPVVLRMGYLWSKNLSKVDPPSKKAIFARYYEFSMIRRAKHVIVTTQGIKQEIISRNSKSRNKIDVIPNYVDTHTFRPASNRAPSNRVIYIGRLSEEKNLFPLIEAVKTENIPLEIIGAGPQELDLKDFASSIGANVTFTGTIPNAELPEKLNQAKLFVLPSLFEGHPKALLEAMACGLAVIGTDVEGIREIVHHGETGWLCQADADSIRTAIHHLLSHPDLCASLGERAREYIVKNFSLNLIADQEFALYQQISSKDYHVG
jgi:glycosyltransferase involved in cell wall biosynthesis